MRIGELAAVVGITPRAVRHYHRIDLLPEPPRQPNGYRDYTLRHAVVLARVRRLTELGLSLDEVGEVLSEDAGKDLAEVLAELDADLARQEEAITQRRARLAQLLRQAETDGRLSDEAPVSPGLAALFEDMAGAVARLPGPEPAMAAKERELLALLETNAPGSGHGRQSWLEGLLSALRSDPGAVESAYAVYAQLDDLAGADEDDPRVERTARAIADGMPEAALEALALAALPEPTELPDGQRPEGTDAGFAEAFFADFAPAQAAAIRRAVRLIRERNR